MKKYFSIFTLFVALLFTGCGYIQPEIPHYSIATTDKVGYIIDIEDKIEHSHLGTTVFNNFEKTYNYSWNYSEYVNDYVKKKTTAKFVDLSNLGFKSEDLKGLVTEKDGKWAVGNEKIYNKLKKLDLKAILLINDEPSSIYMYPISYNIEGTGLIS